MFEKVRTIFGIEMMDVQTPTAHAFAGNSQRDVALQKAAKDMEAAFLAEMLKSAGLGQSRTEFGGGAGEDQFSSFLVQAQAEHMVQAGGIGLAEAIFDALKERQNDG